MKFKMFSILVCALLLVFSFSACSKKTTDSETILPDKDNIVEEPDEEELPDATVNDGSTEVPDKDSEPEPEPESDVNDAEESDISESDDEKNNIPDDGQLSLF